MNVLVIIDPKGQQPELGSHVNSMMKRQNWIAIPGFPYTYTKEVKSEDTNYLVTVVREEVNTATRQAEWQQVKYLYALCGIRPQLEETR